MKKALLILLCGTFVLIGCGDKNDPYKESTTGAGGAGPGYDGTGSGPAATNVNVQTNN